MDLTFMTENIDSKTNKYINNFTGILDDEEKDDPIVIMELHIEKIRHKLTENKLEIKNKKKN